MLVSGILLFSYNNQNFVIVIVLKASLSKSWISIYVYIEVVNRSTSCVIFYDSLFRVNNYVAPLSLFFYVSFLLLLNEGHGPVFDLGLP